MPTFVWQKRLHSLNRPAGPLVNHLAQFERLLTEQDYPQESIRRHLHEQICGDYRIRGALAVLCEQDFYDGQLFKDHPANMPEVVGKCFVLGEHVGDKLVGLDSTGMSLRD